MWTQANMTLANMLQIFQVMRRRVWARGGDAVCCEASEWISTTDIPRLLQRAVCAADCLPLPEWCHAHALGLTILQLSHGSSESLLCLLIKA